MQALSRFLKGKVVHIPLLECGTFMATQMIRVLQEEASGSVIFSLLLVIALESIYLEIGNLSGQSVLLSETSGALSTAPEKPGELISRATVRTYIRIRSPRLRASGPQKKVGKGSRQNGSVTSGKGLALRVGIKDLLYDVDTQGGLLDAPLRIVDYR